jgi:hypothetical protein
LRTRHGIASSAGRYRTQARRTQQDELADADQLAGKTLGIDEITVKIARSDKVAIWMCREKDA